MDSASVSPVPADRCRARTIPARRLSRSEVALGKLLALPLVGVKRPVTRGDCEHAARPCPWVSCKYHLYLDVDPETGSLKINFPGVPPDELGLLEDTCVLDVADRGGITFDAVGELLNVTRERARQLEASGLEWAARAMADHADHEPAGDGR